MIVAEKVVLFQTLALLPSLLIFGKIPNVLTRQFELFWVLALNRGSHSHTHPDLCFLQGWNPLFPDGTPPLSEAN